MNRRQAISAISVGTIVAGAAASGIVAAPEAPAAAALTPAFGQDGSDWRFVATFKNTTATEADLPTLLQESSVTLDGKVHKRQVVKFGGRSNLRPGKSWTFTIQMGDYLGRDASLAAGRHTLTLRFGGQAFGPVEFVWAAEDK
jgi:hypothetical protein